MPDLFGKRLNRKEIEKYVGNMDQLGGLRRSTLSDGMGRGLDIIDIRTGGGLCATITPGRTLDILDVTLNGAPLGWMTANGPVHPAYAHEEDMGFLRSFAGGFMTTCGPSHIGGPTVDQGEPLGLHGRFPTLPARNVNTCCRWEGNDYVMTIEGEVRDYMLYGPHFRLQRRITAWLGENRLRVEDEVENCAPQRMPHQILYHLNMGYPLVDTGAEMRINSKKTIWRETGKESPVSDWGKFPAPDKKFQQECFFHEPKADSKGMASAAVVNPKANGGNGLAVVVKQSIDTLPWTMQWRCALAGDYVEAIEPANSWVIGRDKDREAGRLVFMKSGEVRKYVLEFEFLSGKKELANIKI